MWFLENLWYSKLRELTSRLLSVARQTTCSPKMFKLALNCLSSANSLWYDYILALRVYLRYEVIYVKYQY